MRIEPMSCGIDGEKKTEKCMRQSTHDKRRCLKLRKKQRDKRRNESEETTREEENGKARK